MIKKIVSIAVTVIMIFSFTACDGVRLNNYKATKMEELQAYADSKGEDNYSVEGWAEIARIVARRQTSNCGGRKRGKC